MHNVYIFLLTASIFGLVTAPFVKKPKRAAAVSLLAFLLFAFSISRL